MKSLIYSLFVSFVLFGCSQRHTTISPIKIDVSDWPKNISSLDEEIEEYIIIPLETNEDNLIGYIWQIKFTDGKFIVFDGSKNSKFLLFDSKGNYLNSIGSVGKGPGEYLYASSFTLNTNQDQILIFDIRKRSLIYYTLSGEYIKEVRLLKQGILELINDDLFAIQEGRMGPIGIQEKHFELWLLNKQGEIVDRLFHYEKSLGSDINSGFAKGTSPGILFYHKMYDYNIYTISSEGIDTIYRFDFGKANVDTLNLLTRQVYSNLWENDDKISGISHLANTRDALAVGLVSGYNSRGLVLINHDTQNYCFYTCDSTGLGTYKHLPVPVPDWSNNTHFIAELDAFEWQSHLKNIPESQKVILREQISGFQQSEDLTENDNPVLILFKFKEF